MEELLVYIILAYRKLISEIEYNTYLDQLFLNNPENDDLLYLEWETDIKRAFDYVSNHINYNISNLDCFGKLLMNHLKVIYENCTDIKWFANQMYDLWKSLPKDIQYSVPFCDLCYADDPLSWNDEHQVRVKYEVLFHYYEN